MKYNGCAGNKISPIKVCIDKLAARDSQVTHMLSITSVSVKQEQLSDSFILRH